MLGVIIRYAFMSLILFPVSMENAFGIHTLVGVSAKIITLGLDQISRQPGAAVAIEISKGSHQTGNGKTSFPGQANDCPQIFLYLP